jgi:hypothetical protein
MLNTIKNLLASYSYTFRDEAELQALVARALDAEHVCYTREYALTAADRVDFMATGLGIECKTHDSVPSVLRQLLRYEKSEDIRELLLITSLTKHRVIESQWASLSKKPLAVLFVTRGI